MPCKQNNLPSSWAKWNHDNLYYIMIVSMWVCVCDIESDETAKHSTTIAVICPLFCLLIYYFCVYILLFLTVYACRTLMLRCMHSVLIMQRRIWQIFSACNALGAKQAERMRREWKRREWKPSTQLHLWIATRACPELCIWNVIWCSQIYCAKSKDFQFDDRLEWQCVCLNVCDTHAWLFSLVVMFPLLH